MSGREALSMAEDKKYDLMFIDHMMPEMDGVETLKHLRESGANTETPAVALTANAVSGARQMYLQSGFTDYLSKPVDGKRLERMICRLVSEDKIIHASEDETSGGSNEADENLPDWLKEIDDIDKEAGLSNCGGAEEYLSVLDVFHKTADAKAKEIKDYYDRDDLEDYTIKVHALKSSARIIGAEELSDLARRLEEAGNSKDKEFIDKNTDKLLSMYHALDDELSSMDGDDEDRPVISEKELNEAYQTIYEVAQSMDYELMDDVLKSIREYSLAEEDEDRIRAVELKFTELDWDGICEIVKDAIR
jgi:CheY-like chemotaxis protein